METPFLGKAFEGMKINPTPFSTTVIYADAVGAEEQAIASRMWNWLPEREGVRVVATLCQSF